MTEVWNAVMTIGLVLVVSWVLFFGTFGALLAKRREGLPIEGFALGALLGPFGWVVTWLRTRERSFSGYEEIEDGSDAWSAL